MFLTNRSHSMLNVGSECNLEDKRTITFQTQRCIELECKFATFKREVMIDFDVRVFFSRWLAAQYD